MNNAGVFLKDQSVMFPAIFSALMRNIGADMAETLELEEEETDHHLLATIPVLEYCRRYNIDALGMYVVWMDNTMGCIFIDKSEDEEFRTWQEDMVIFHRNFQPIASYFVERRRYDVKHIVIVYRLARRAEVVVHRQPDGFDLETAALEIMAAFQNGGEQGLADFVSRFDTGIGNGERRLITAELPGVS